MNENDLFEELLRYCFTGVGMSAAEAELKIIEFRKHFKTNPAKELSDEDYFRKLAEFKKQAPAYLYELLTRDFPTPPDDFFPKHNTN